MSEKPEEQWAGDDLGPEDMAIPEIKLIQNVGGALAKQSGAVPGDFYCSLTDEILKGFDLVVVKIHKNRTYWGRTEILDEPPECASLDARSMLSINGDNCSDCELRSETPGMLTAEERRKKCLVNYNIIGIKLPEQIPVLIRSSGISAQSAKDLYTQFYLNKQLKGAWYKAKTYVTSVPKKSSAGDAFAMRFSKLELLPAEQLPSVQTLSRQLLGTQVALPEGREEIEAEPEITPEAKRKLLEEGYKLEPESLTGTKPEAKTKPVAKELPTKTPPKLEEPPTIEEPPIDVEF